jgi:hypothetical protein
MDNDISDPIGPRGPSLTPGIKALQDLLPRPDELWWVLVR